MPLVHSLKEMGIPFLITRNLDQALKHRLVILYPSVDAHTFNEDQAKQLTTFVENGGTVFAQNVFWGGLRDLFGFREFKPSRKRYHLAFVGQDPVLKYLNRPQEREVHLGSESYDEIFWSNGYVLSGGAVALAGFDDGTAALLSHAVGKGRVYLLGLSLMDVVLRSQSNRDFEAERHYVNAFEPGADVWLLILRAWYEAYGGDWVRLTTIPNGQRSVLLLSHDVDWQNSFAPCLDFARIEKADEAKSTFFIQTKYVDDANSKAFFWQSLGLLREIKAGGSTLGSHSVIHSRGFNKFDLGSGQERYANYHPRGLGYDTASGATVFGEMRVSKELLDGQIPEQNTIFFRAGHLRVPSSLPEALERSGYEFDSSFTADDVLSNFPYALPLNLGFEEDSQIYEFPVTIEDEEPPGFANRLPQALEVILANAENEAVNVLLVHSNESAQKAAAEQDLLRQLPTDIGKSDMLNFARFWQARDRLKWSISPGSEGNEVALEVSTEEPVEGLTFAFRRPISQASKGATISSDRHRVTLPEVNSGQTAVIELRLAR
ncbi:MAG TPA: hypothetical protein VEI52_08770 [Terriglobales bacterium]|nr:hypothetical protein [Terriglobales bacterium]